jgi:hypothetical protein
MENIAMSPWDSEPRIPVLARTTTNLAILASRPMAVFFVLSKTYTCFEMGPHLLPEEEGDYWSLSLYRGVTQLHALTVGSVGALSLTETFVTTSQTTQHRNIQARYGNFCPVSLSRDPGFEP